MHNVEKSGGHAMSDQLNGMSSPLPRTPVQMTPIRDSESEVAAASVVLTRSATRLKVHPHGLLAKVNPDDSLFNQGSPKSLNRVERTSDRSLDCVRRSDLEGNNNALERIDINQMFSTSQDHVENNSGRSSTIRVNHSPMRLDMSSPIKTNGVKEEEGPQPKRLKLELECVPNLGQPGQEDGKEREEPVVGSPEVIEMIDTKSSPMKEFSQAECDKARESEEGSNDTPKRRESDLHTLTPVHKGDNDFDRHLDDLEMDEEFHLITSRNEELIKQVHLLNRKLNKVMTSCDVAFIHYKKMKAEYDSLAADSKQKLSESYEELLTVSKERDKFKSKADKLKNRIDESHDEFYMLKQNQSILQSKYETLIDETDTVKKRESGLNAECFHLKEKIATKEREYESLKEELKNVSTQLQEVSANSTNLEHEKKELENQVAELQEKLANKINEFENLQTQLQHTISAEQGANNEIVARMNDVVAQKTNIEAEFEAFKAAAEADRDSIQKRTDEIERQSTLMEKELKDFKDRSEHLQEELSAKMSHIEQMKKRIEELNDDTEIGKAEVKELQEDKMELERTNACLESSIAELEENVREWQNKFHQKESKEKISLELESIQLKNSNIEAEHLAEVEQLQRELKSLKDLLRGRSEEIDYLNSLNEELKQENKALEEKCQKSLDEQRRSSNGQSVETLEKEVAAWKEKYQAKEIESNKSLKLLAEDLYIQYSSKHEQKVKLLKKGYETKFQGKLDRIALQNEGLLQEVELLKGQLATERKEKQKLLEVLETKK